MSELSFTRPDPHDFLDVDGLLDDDERLLRDTVRRFVGDRILPEIAGWWEEGVFPKEMAKDMGAMGLFGMHLDGYGCAGVSNVMYGLACRELEFGDSGVRSFVSVQGSLAMFPIWKFGSEDQKQTWLPRMAAGEAIGCFGLTEADSGSDPSSMRTVARRDAVALDSLRRPIVAASGPRSFGAEEYSPAPVSRPFPRRSAAGCPK